MRAFWPVSRTPLSDRVCERDQSRGTFRESSSFLSVVACLNCFAGWSCRVSGDSCHRRAKRAETNLMFTPCKCLMLRAPWSATGGSSFAGRCSCSGHSTVGHQGRPQAIAGGAPPIFRPASSPFEYVGPVCHSCSPSKAAVACHMAIFPGVPVKLCTHPPHCQGGATVASSQAKA